jgi:hypothetical protein
MLWQFFFKRQRILGVKKTTNELQVVVPLQTCDGFALARRDLQHLHVESL